MYLECGNGEILQECNISPGNDCLACFFFYDAELHSQASFPNLVLNGICFELVSSHQKFIYILGRVALSKLLHRVSIYTQVFLSLDLKGQLRFSYKNTD